MVDVIEYLYSFAYVNRAELENLYTVWEHSIEKIEARSCRVDSLVLQVGVDYAELQAALKVVPRDLAQYR